MVWEEKHPKLKCNNCLKTGGLDAKMKIELLSESSALCRMQKMPSGKISKTYLKAGLVAWTLDCFNLNCLGIKICLIENRGLSVRAGRSWGLYNLYF